MAVDNENLSNWQKPGNGPGSLIRAKLKPRISSAPTLFRQHVLDRLSAPPVPMLTLLSAPAGYGKTTTLRQWWQQLHDNGVRAAWLSLDRADAEPALFVAYLVASFDAAGVDMGDLMTAARTKLLHTPVDAVLAPLVNAIAAAPQPLFIFIDDYQMASGPGVDRVLNEILAYIPGSVHLVLATRTRPALQVADLRAKQEIREFDARDLRFDRDECVAFFGYQDETTGALVANAEGWPAALQLARLWIERRETEPRSRAGRPPELAFSGRSSDLANYLVEQVFANLPGTLGDRLLRIAILERFNGDLINQLCDCTDGWDMVEELMTRNLFVTPLDDESCWYSLHQLFREFLYERLRRTEPDKIPQLHKLAAHWYAAYGSVEDALLHASNLDDPSFVADTLTRVGGWSVALSQGVRVLRTLMVYSPEVAYRHPAIALAQIYALMQRGEIKRARMLYGGLARTLLERSQGGGANQADVVPDVVLHTELSMRFLENVLVLYEDRAIDRRDVAWLNERLVTVAEKLPELDLIGALDCYACYQHSEFEKCLEQARAALAKFARKRAFYGAFFINCYAGLAESARGRLDAAAAAFEEGIRVASTYYSVHSDQVAVARIFLAEIAYERNDVDHARALLDQSFDDIRRTGGWFDVLAAGFVTRTSIMLLDGSPDEALAYLDRGTEYSHERNLPRLRSVLMVQRVRVLRRAGRIDEATALVDSPAFDAIIDPPNHEHGPDGSEVDVRLPQTRDPALLVRAGMLAHRNCTREAMALIEGVMRDADRIGHVRRAIRSRLAAAVVASRAGDDGGALRLAAEALERADGQGFIRSFLDEGEPVLSLVRAVMDAPSAGKAAAWGRTVIGAALPDDAGDLLSTREREVLDLLARGYSSKEMARTLDLAEGTVKVHRKRLYRKLGAHNRSTALALARERNFLT